MGKSDSRWATMRVPAVVGVLLVALIAAAHVSGLPLTVCKFKLLTGLPCPTCGTTRAVLALLDGNFMAALRCNPLLVCGAAAAGPLLVLYRLRRRWIASRTAFAVLGLAVTANWLYLIAVGR